MSRTVARELQDPPTPPPLLVKSVAERGEESEFYSL